MNRPDPGERPSTRRKWAAIGSATLLLTASVWAVLFAFRAWFGEVTAEEIQAGTQVPITTGVVLALVGAFSLMAAGFGALAVVSRHPRPLRSVAVASFLGGAMWLWLPFLVGEPVTPMVAGFGAGGLVALRAEPEHRIGRRALAAAGVTVYMFLLLRFTPLAGVIVAPLLPLPALAWADALAERRAAERPALPDRPGPRRKGR